MPNTLQHDSALSPLPSFPEPSAPQLEPIELQQEGLLHLSHDQAVEWWNGLVKTQREGMLQAVSTLKVADLKRLREDYKLCYPQEYFPKKTLAANSFSALDFYLMYFFSENLANRYSWFSEELSQAFAVLPPPYVDEPSPPDYASATSWWDNLTQAQRDAIQAQPLVPQQLTILRREFASHYQAYSPVYLQPAYPAGYYDYFLISRYNQRMYTLPFWYTPDYLWLDTMRMTIAWNQMMVNGVVTAGRFIGQGLVYGAHAAFNVAKAIGEFFEYLGGALSADSKSAAKIAIGVALVVGLVVTATSAVIGAAYAGGKALKSVVNLAHGRKIARSLWRLACTAATTYAGVTQGILVGALVGSAFPGFGTLAGAIVGGIFGAGIGAGIGAAFAKYSAQLVSWWRHKDDTLVVSKTNPEWSVRKVEAAFEKTHTQMSTKMSTIEIRDMLRNLRDNKAKLDAKEDKKQCRSFKEALEMGKDPRGLVRIDGKACFTWDAERKEVRKVAKVQPRPVGLRI